MAGNVISVIDEIITQLTRYAGGVEREREKDKGWIGRVQVRVRRMYIYVERESNTYWA